MGRYIYRRKQKSYPAYQKLEGRHFGNEIRLDLRGFYPKIHFLRYTILLLIYSYSLTSLIKVQYFQWFILHCKLQSTKIPLDTQCPSRFGFNFQIFAEFCINLLTTRLWTLHASIGPLSDKLSTPIDIQLKTPTNDVASCFINTESCTLIAC